MSANASSLDRLNNDVMHLIITSLVAHWSESEIELCIEKSADGEKECYLTALQSFAATCKRYRDMCYPILFRKVILHGPSESIREGLAFIERNEKLQHFSM